MSKVLESLVARGRRTKNFREQREITFGLADLSTRTDIHERLVKKGGVITLVDILSTSQDAEAQQFASIAVANTSSTTSLCNDIIKLEGVVNGLIQYVGNESADAMGRQYCAMALGNLLAEPSTHEAIVELNVTVALITMLKNCTDGRELESGRHAAFALSNLSSNVSYHEQIVEHGAIELLIALACCEDIDTQRQAISALRGLCLTPSNRVTVVKKGILDPLILVSTSDDVEIVREVSSALNCLSSHDDNKEEISYRTMSTLIHLMISGDNDIERHASSAIGNLMEMIDIHPRFVEEKGIPPLISLCSSSDQSCRVEATRAVANLSSNPDLIEALIDNNVLAPIIKSIEVDGDMGEYSTLALANFATNSPSLFKIVQAGAIPHLVNMISNADNINCRRYGTLAIANITACETFHPPIMAAGAPEALFALTNSSDDTSNRYVACALANLSSNASNHMPIVEMGGLQPIIALVHDTDPSIHKQAAAALRGFSATGNTKMKIVQEGGLEPLRRLLLSKDDLILRETTACFCNLSLSDENKFEVVKSGAVMPLINLMQSEDPIVSCHACECLANLAEMPDNQDFIVSKGAITPCIDAMRSRHIGIQRESGRLIANLAASETKLAANTIIDEAGHLVLVSYLLSQDIACQRVGSFGIGNLATHNHHRVTLIKAGALEPLTSLTRSTTTQLEIRRFSMLAIANLAASFDTHDEFVSQGTIPMLISFSNSNDTEMRNYAAYAVAQLSKNSDMMEIVTSEGGLEPVLYLGRSDDKTVQREVLPALTTLSFMDCNKIPICDNGSLLCIIDFINESRNSVEESQLACCSVANLIEAANNMTMALHHGCVPLLVEALKSTSETVQREAARAIGNLAVNMSYVEEILNHSAVLTRLVACFQGRNIECQRSSAFAMSNISSNIRSHDELLKHDILGLVKNECQASLDPKRFSDHETVRFCLLILANLTGNLQNHSSMDSFFDIFMDFTRHRDALCRQHAVLALGNLCAEPTNAKQLVSIKCMEALVAFSFPPTTDGLVNAQFQAIAGLRGLSKHPHLREAVMQESGLEPLILAMKGNNQHADIEIQREATSTISNLAIEEKNRLTIAKSGALPSLVTLTKSPDSMCTAFAVAALANLAETSHKIHDLIFGLKADADVIGSFCELAQNCNTHVDIKRDISRCFALFASNEAVHSMVLVDKVTASIKVLTESRDMICQRYGALTVSNLALIQTNHCVLLKAKLLESVISLVNSHDIETLRGTAFALHSLSFNESNHSSLEHAGAVESCVPLLQCGDRDTTLQACLTVKYLSKCNNCRIKFVESHGLEPLLVLSSSTHLETKRELAAALRNISLSDTNKAPVMREGFDFITTLCRDSDSEVSHQACGVIANISEKQDNKVILVGKGIIHHLQAVLSFSDCIPVLRESTRSFASLSSAIDNTAKIVNSGVLGVIARALNSNDTLCRRFAAMALSNLAVNTEIHSRIIHEIGMPLFVLTARQGDRNFIDIKTQQNGMASLANLASCNQTHNDLTTHGCIDLAIEHVKSSDLDLRRNALLLLANLSSNKANHYLLENSINLKLLVENLECHNHPTVQLHAISCLRGLSTDVSIRKKIIHSGSIEVLLSLVHCTDDVSRLEVLSTLCNLSLGGGFQANTVLEKIDMPSVIKFLCNGDSTTHRMFGAVALGNIASDVNLQANVFGSGALKPLIELSENATELESESKRLMAYAICNLSAELPNRLSIITQGGLASIMYLCHTGDISDMLAALSTLRGLSASANARRLIFEEGVLHVLVLGTNSGNLQCKQEVASILVNLTLNEENKYDVARSTEIQVISSLLDETDVSCISDSCRSFGNICEVDELHPDVLRLLTAEKLVLLSSPNNELEITREVARCIVNMSSNFKMHKDLVQPHLLENIGLICTNTMSDALNNGETTEKTDIIRLSTLALANFCQNTEVHKRLDFNRLLLIFDAVISWDNITAASEDLINEAKCYACMAVSAICTYPTSATLLLKIGFIPALLKLTETHSPELSMYSAFVLKGLSTVTSTHQEFGLQRVSSKLARHVLSTNEHYVTYSTATMRMLSDDEKIRSELIDGDVLDFLTGACDNQNVERSREIAACVCHLGLWNEAKLQIAKSSMLTQIVSLCYSVDTETSRFALGSLANISEDAQSHGTIMQKSSIIRQMLRLTQTETIPIAREATRVLANLFSSESTHGLFLREDGMAFITRVSEVQDIETAQNAAVAFRKLASNSKTHEAFLEESIHAVIKLTKSDDQQTALQSVAALRDISSNPEFQLVFVEVGAMSVAVDLTESDASDDVKIVTMGIIRHLSISMPLKTKILQSGIVQVMTRCIESYNNADLLYECVFSIANLAEHAQNKVALVQMGTLRLLISLCNCTSANVQQETARAFSLLSSAPENTSSFDNHVLSSIIDLLGCPEEDTGRHSASAIANVAMNRDKKELVGKCHGIAPLVELLKSPYESCQTISSKALSRLTDLEENKVSVYLHEGLAPLLNICNTSSTTDHLLAAAAVLVNISSCADHKDSFIEEGALGTLKPFLTNGNQQLRQYVVMVLCNLSSHNSTIDHVAKQIDLLLLIESMNDDHAEIRSYATMTVCNLASKQIHGAAILMTGGVTRLAKILNSYLDKAGTLPLQRAALLATYNISTYEASHSLLAKEEVIKPIISSCRSQDVLSRRCALLILSNLACNDKIRTSTTKGGGLQAAILALKDEDITTTRYACICLSNMANESNTQSQILVHGGLPSLVSLSERVDDKETSECAIMCLSNLAANESNQVPMMKQGGSFITVSPSNKNPSVYHLFAIANLTSNPEILSQLGRGGGIRALLTLVRSNNLHFQCSAIAGLRRLLLTRENRDRFIVEGGVSILATHSCKTSNIKGRTMSVTELQREIASCFCNLTLNKNHRFDVTRTSIAEISLLSQSSDPETVRLSLGAIGNLAEDVDTHPYMEQANCVSSAIAGLGHQKLDIKREASRAVANLLSSKEFHSDVIENGLDSLIDLSAETGCDECQYLTALSFRKLSPTRLSHNVLINYGLQNLLALTRVPNKMTRKHAATAIRDLSGFGGKNISVFFSLGTVATMTELIKDNEKELQIIAMATLRHLSPSTHITDDFSRSVLVKCVVRCISWANDDMKCQIAGLMANLSEHGECHSTMIAQGVVPALGKLASTDSSEIKQDCGRAFANLCSNEEKQTIIYRQGGLKTLVSLSKTKCEVCQRYVAIAMRFMASAREVQRSISKQNEFSPFLELSTSELIDYKRASAASMASLSLNQIGKTMILKKGGIRAVLRLCVHLDSCVQREAVFCIANFVASSDFRQYVSKEGGIETLKAVVTTCTDTEILRDASRALSSLSNHIPTRAIMISQEIPQLISKLAKSSDNSTQRFAALALCNLCQGTREQKELVVKQGALRILLFLLRFPDLEIERCASLAIAALSLGSDDNKSEIMSNGFVRPLLDAITYPDVNMRRSALLALNTISNGKSKSHNVKQQVFIENGLSPLLTLVKSQDDESIHAGIFLLGTLAENMEICDSMVAMDFIQLLVEKIPTSSIEIKRAAAYLFSLLSENPDYHDSIRSGGALESIIALAALVDDECQDYGAFTLAFLANNKSFQVPLVNLGAVRPLVSMMANNSDAKHYASLALLKLADNFENHIRIAEEGGIQALLALGRSKVSNEQVTYQANKSVSRMAKHMESKSSGSL